MRYLITGLIGPLAQMYWSVFKIQTRDGRHHQSIVDKLAKKYIADN